jgi:transposase
VIRKCSVVLSEDQEAQLLEVVSRGVANARTIRRAHTLLYAWEGYGDEEIAERLRCSPNTVANTRKAFRDRGLASLHDKPRPGAVRKLDGEAEAHLVALACSGAPEGKAHWTMQLLADQLVVLGLVDSISDETVRRVLKNRRSSRG